MGRCSLCKTPEFSYIEGLVDCNVKMRVLNMAVLRQLPRLLPHLQKGKKAHSVPKVQIGQDGEKDSRIFPNPLSNYKACHSPQ